MCVHISYGVYFQNHLINFTYLLDCSEALCLECCIFISPLAITELPFRFDGYSLKAEVLGAHVFKEAQDREQSSGKMDNRPIIATDCENKFSPFHELMGSDV